VTGQANPADVAGVEDRANSGGLAMLRDLKSDGMTMIVATHEMGFARQVADEVCFLDGPPGQVLGEPVHERTGHFLSRIIDAGRL
jgi:polar amino acid transport system ATP-binding protein